MIYLDYSATTKVNDAVLEVFNKVNKEYYANSNSIHSLGVKSKQLEEYATKKIADLLKVKPTEIIYTSGSSESNNTIIKGVCNKYKNRGNHIITTKLEHSSVIEPLKYLEKNGFVVDYVKIKDNGLIDLEDLKQLLTEKTILVIVSAVDSEVGVKQNINEIGLILKEYPKCFFHVDATQAIGKIHCDFTNVDFVSISAHKFYGLKGIGLLIKKENIEIEPLIHGGKSTSIYRSGTPPLPLIVSLLKALELILPQVDKNFSYIEKLNKMIIDVLSTYEYVTINATPNSIPHIINFSISKIKPETLIHALEEEEVYISTKSACSKPNEMSSSVYAITKNKDISYQSLRISLSYLTEEIEVQQFLKIFDTCYNSLLLK